MHKILLDFKIQMDPLFLTRRPNLVLIKKKWKQKEKRTCHLMNFVISLDHRVKIKESKNIDKYLDHARERRKL